MRVVPATAETFRLAEGPGVGRRVCYLKAAITKGDIPPR